MGRQYIMTCHIDALVPLIPVLKGIFKPICRLYTKLTTQLTLTDESTF